MEIRHLRALHTIVTTGSFTEAAQRLFVTQSALSHQIQQLEQELGQRLLIRSRGGAQPTVAGEEALASATRILADVDHLHHYFRGESAGPRGQIRAVSSAMGFVHFYGDVCEQFIRAHPDIELVLRTVENPFEGAGQVRAGTTDLAFSSLPLPSALSSLPAIPLGINENVLIASPDHPLAAFWPSVQLKELARHPFILLEKGTGVRQIFQELFAAETDFPRVLLETNDTEYIKRLVMLGRGAALIPATAARREVQQGRLKILLVQGQRLYKEFGLVHREGRVPGLIQVFIDFCRQLPYLDRRLRLSPSGEPSFRGASEAEPCNEECRVRPPKTLLPRHFQRPS